MSPYNAYKQLLFLILILIPIYLISSHFDLKFDMSSNKSYSINENTVEFLKQYNDPIYIEWWLSESLQSEEISFLKNQFNQLLKRNKLPVNGQIQYVNGNNYEEFIKKGARELVIEVDGGLDIERNKVISTMEITFLNKKILIHEMTWKNWEFLLIEALDQMTNGKKSIGIFPDADENNPNGIYTLLTSELIQSFHVHSFNYENPLTFAPDLLIVPDRKEFYIEELYAIDSAIQAGSVVIFFVDGFNIDPASKQYAYSFKEKSVIKKLLQVYGVEVGKLLISDKNNLYRYKNPLLSEEYSNYYKWFKSSQDLDILWASPLNIREIEGITTRVLDKSSDYSWVEYGEIDLNPHPHKNNEDILYTGPYNLSIEITGNLKPLFIHEQINSQKKDKILVYGSSYTFSDFMIKSQSTKNLKYFRKEIYSLLDKPYLYKSVTLGNSDNYMHLRTFLEDQNKRMIFLINFIMAPIVISAIYLVLVSKRRRNRHNEDF